MIPLLKPNPPTPDKWLPYLDKSYAASTFSNNGPNVQLLETRLGKFLQTQTTPVLMCNATLALTVTLRAFGLEGSEILMPSFTFMATAHSVREANCTPVLVDTNFQLDLDLNDAENKITPNTRAIVVVHSLGYVTDYKQYENFANKYGLKLIFDSAALLGAKYENGKMVGTAGDCEVFSLHITKTFGVGEGALVSSHDPVFLQKCRKMINFGMGQDGIVKMWGTNAKMSDFHAAIGNAVLDGLQKSLATRKRIYDAYQLALKHRPDIQGFNKPTSHQVFPLLFDSRDRRNQVIELFKSNGIGYKVYYTPIHIHPEFNVQTDTLSKTNCLYERTLCIPFYETMTVDEMSKVVEIMVLAWTHM